MPATPLRSLTALMVVAAAFCLPVAGFTVEIAGLFTLVSTSGGLAGLA